MPISLHGPIALLSWGGLESRRCNLKGLQVSRRGQTLKRYQEIYFGVWPEGQAHLKWPDIAYFVVRPRWIRYSDYDQTPPVIEEFALGS